MGSCISFDSECVPAAGETIDDRFTHCCDDEIEAITYNKDGWQRLLNEIEIISTAIYAIVSELLLSDNQYFMRKAFTAWKCTMS